MKLYDFACGDCAHGFEDLVRAGEPSTCTQRGSAHVARQLSAFSVGDGRRSAPRAGTGAAAPAGLARESLRRPLRAAWPCRGDGRHDALHPLAVRAGEETVCEEERHGAQHQRGDPARVNDACVLADLNG